MDHSLSGSSVCGVLQTRILELVAISFSKGFSLPRDRTQVSCIVSRFFTEPPQKPRGGRFHPSKPVPPFQKSSLAETCLMWTQACSTRSPQTRLRGDPKQEKFQSLEFKETEDNYQMKVEGPLDLSFLIYKMQMIRDLVIKVKTMCKTLKIKPWSIILSYYVNHRTGKIEEMGSRS